MATIVLSAAGAAIGGSIGGSVAGLSSAVIGRAIGASIGRVIDDRISSRVSGQGAEPVETGKVDRFRLTQTGEGAPIARVFGRMRVGGQVIWASQFRETATVTPGSPGSSSRGKGGGGRQQSAPQPQRTEYSYSVSLAIAICEGEVLSVGRVWADGEEVSPEDLNMRVYRGTPDQLPDPVIEAIEGQGQVPAYRGTAYVVMDDLPLGGFGNRVPQISFEVVRMEQNNDPEYNERLSQIIKGVSIIPSTGEYALATGQQNYTDGPGSFWPANMNTATGQSDFTRSMQSLSEELPGCQAASLVVSWFGNDLRCGSCEILPKIERRVADGHTMPWQVAGLTRATAPEIAKVDGEPVYGGTPTDQSVIEAIRHLKATGKRVMFYPFILMEQLQNNGLQDPWTGAANQPPLPWRGRITLSAAPGQPGSPDQTSAADVQVQAFFGTASAAHFTVSGDQVEYSGPSEWGFRRFILHYAALCKAAGGVSAFCIGSEMRALTQIRGEAGFPAVEQLKELAGEVRAILGSDVRLGYAADWSEYFGYQPTDGSGDRYFHLDPLWSDDNIDFVGIDNYMPLSDWRDEDDHVDAAAGAPSIYDLDYLRSNVEGGEGYDWYYASPDAEVAQNRTPITDQEHDEPWIWRYKDIRNWWSNPHHERIGGERQVQQTGWIPQSKPIWFTEFGCAAVDKGTNQPNKFLDPKSSESKLPKFSNGLRDDLIQIQYLRTVIGHWSDPDNNPVSTEYGGPMLDLSNAYVWTWDARPYPAFPNRRDLWNDGGNYSQGHWLTGRSSNRTLSSVVAEICLRAGLVNFDVRQLWGVVRGYSLEDVADARSALQPLLLRYGFDAIERDGTLVFKMRTGKGAVRIDPDFLAVSRDVDNGLIHSRDPDAEMAGRVRLRFVQSGADHDVVSEEAILPSDETHAVASSEMALSMTRAEGRQTAERWLTEARLARETAQFALPPSHMLVRAGDVVSVPMSDEADDVLFRVDRVEQSDHQILEAVRIEPNVFAPSEMPEDQPVTRRFLAPVPVLACFLDLPLLTGDEIPHAPFVAATSRSWPGGVAIYSSSSDDNYGLNTVLPVPAIMGHTENILSAAPAGLWDRKARLQVQLVGQALESRTREAVLNGANLAAIGDGSNGNWELIQFQSAELIGPDTYELTNLLRGQAGTDALMPDMWPAESKFVLIDPRIAQIGLNSAERRIERHYRIGPSQRSYDDPAYTHHVEAFDGNGLRPYAPVHLRAVYDNGAQAISWIRRSRIDGDDWSLPDVPLGEDVERYSISVTKNGQIFREDIVAEPKWTYSVAMQAEDGAVFPLAINVAQISARFGPGPSSRIILEQ